MHTISVTITEFLNGSIAELDQEFKNWLAGVQKTAEGIPPPWPVSTNDWPADDYDLSFVESTPASSILPSIESVDVTEPSIHNSYADTSPGLRQDFPTAQTSPDTLLPIERPTPILLPERDLSQNSSLQREALTPDQPLTASEEVLNSEPRPLLKCPSCQKTFRRPCDKRYVSSALS